MKKRILAALMTTAMIAAMVTGCGNSSNAASTATDTKEETADAGETTPGEAGTEAAASGDNRSQGTMYFTDYNAD